jgi:hypothetical protein
MLNLSVLVPPTALLSIASGLSAVPPVADLPRTVVIDLALESLVASDDLRLAPVLSAPLGDNGLDGTPSARKARNS